jgi:hypothetical protein
MRSRFAIATTLLLSAPAYAETMTMPDGTKMDMKAMASAKKPPEKFKAEFPQAHPIAKPEPMVGMQMPKNAAAMNGMEMPKAGAPMQAMKKRGSQMQGMKMPKSSAPRTGMTMPMNNVPANASAPKSNGAGNGAMGGMDMSKPMIPAEAAPKDSGTSGGTMGGMDMPMTSPTNGAAMPGMTSGASSMAGMDMSGGMMAGQAGSYAMTRDASGTSWQPESSPMQGTSFMLGGWSAMLHGSVTGIYDYQGGKRGDDKVFVESMVMAMAQTKAGPGTLTLRAMLSLDPLMGKSGYPLLLQTGETANGVTPLVDRQHPHDLFMELAGIYSVAVGNHSSLFAYVGYPGEPALGPPAFMHRFSGMEDPAAPISHHWLDSTHITYGVVTTGFVAGDWKIEGSGFRGREPDQFRWNFDPLTLDSASARLSWNPDPNWALQVSHGFLKSSEQLEPATNQHRTTASASYNLPIDHGNWQTTLAWGRNNNHPGNTLDAFLLESALTWQQHTFFGRAENAAKDELFQLPSALAGRIFNVNSLSLGYIYDIPVADHFSLGLGAMGTLDLLPSAIEPAYGGNPTSYMLFTRIKII